MAYSGKATGADLDRTHISTEGEVQEGKTLVAGKDKEITKLGDIGQDSTSLHYWGEKTVDGSFRMGIIENLFVIQKRIEGVWTDMLSLPS